MQVYNKSNSIGIKTLLLFVAVLAIAYLPVSTFLYFIKNDAFNGYFPPRFFMSESLHSGILPLWNPYINFGFPQYGDMSSGYWSPVTWLIAGTIGYNAYIFTIEILLYLLIGGLGMYRLAGLFTSDPLAGRLAGLAFMCCGFNIGHLQHVNWLSGLALLTWCSFYFITLQKKSTLLITLTAALVFYLFLSSAHPTLIISAFYFMVIFLGFGYFKNDIFPGWRTSPHPYLKFLFILTITVSLLSAGLIVGYLDILPHFVRGQKINLAISLENAVPLRTWVSTILPLSVNKDPGLISTDPSSRNHYMGLVILVFFLTAILQKKSRWQWCLLLTGIFFLALSTGGIFKTTAYYILPFMSYVRLNGIYTGITLVCFILFTAIGIGRLKHEHAGITIALKITGGLVVLFFLAILYGGIQAWLHHDSLLFRLYEIRLSPSPAKALIDTLTYFDTLWIQGIIQFFVLSAIACMLYKKRFKWLLAVTIVDLVLASLLNLPFTGVGNASVADVQRALNRSPAGIIIPSLQPISHNDTSTVINNGLTGHWSMYGKQPGITHEVAYPITLNTAHEYLQTTMTNPGTGYMNRPFLFPVINSPDTPANISLLAYSGSSLSFRYHSQVADTVILQQNAYPYWYYYAGGTEKEILRYGNFMAVPVIRGENTVRVYFKPAKVQLAMVVSLAFFVLLLTWIIMYRLSKSKSS